MASGQKSAHRENYIVKTVLIVDDEPDIRLILKTLLEMMGHTVLSAENGKEGLTLFEENEPDLVITDLVMPVMSGLDLIYAIRIGGRATPIIAISGGGAAAGDILVEAEFAGADTVLAKPFLTSHIRAAIWTYLSDEPVEKLAANG